MVYLYYVGPKNRTYRIIYHEKWSWLNTEYILTLFLLTSYQPIEYTPPHIHFHFGILIYNSISYIFGKSWMAKICNFAKINSNIYWKTYSVKKCAKKRIKISKIFFCKNIELCKKNICSKQQRMVQLLLIYLCTTL